MGVVVVVVVRVIVGVGVIVECEKKWGKELEWDCKRERV